MVKCLFEMCGAPRHLICHGGKFLIYYSVKRDEYLQALRDKCRSEFEERESRTVSLPPLLHVFDLLDRTDRHQGRKICFSLPEIKLGS